MSGVAVLVLPAAKLRLSPNTQDTVLRSLAVVTQKKKKKSGAPTQMLIDSLQLQKNRCDSLQFGYVVWVQKMLNKIPTVPNILVPLMNINISFGCFIIDLEPNTSLEKNTNGSLTDIVRFKVDEWWLPCSTFVYITISNH